MRAKILGIILMILGIIGLVLPIMPGVIFIVIGIALFYKDRLAEIRKNLPEEIPAPFAVAYSEFIAKIFFPFHKKICEEVSLAKGDTLLDLGTGPGALPVELAKRFPDSKIIGIDLSKKMIEIAQKKKNGNRDSGIGNLEFKVMDARALQFPDNSIDIIISTGSMHHWKDPVGIFNEAYRVLKAGHEAWIYDGYGNASNKEINTQMNKIFGILPTPWLARKILSLHGYTEAEYNTIVKDLVARSDFKICSFDKKGIMMRVRLTKSC
jgi:ubiquinone/menaquinone biosynthesis C-methylase UbiE